MPTKKQQQTINTKRMDKFANTAMGVLLAEHPEMSGEDLARKAWLTAAVMESERQKVLGSVRLG